MVSVQFTAAEDSAHVEWRLNIDFHYTVVARAFYALMDHTLQLFQI